MSLYELSQQDNKKYGQLAHVLEAYINEKIKAKELMTVQEHKALLLACLRTISLDMILIISKYQQPRTLRKIKPIDSMQRLENILKQFGYG